MNITTEIELFINHHYSKKKIIEKFQQVYEPTHDTMDE